MTSPLILAFAGAAGLALGSFAVTAGLRASRAQGALSGRSRCDACGAGLSYARTVPLLSFAVARGRCGDCGARIDPLHLAGEICGALIAMAAVTVPPAAGALVAILGLCLVTLATVDLRAGRLPNDLCAVVAAAAGGLAVLHGRVAFGLGFAMAAGLIGVLLVLRRLSQARRGDPGLGMGDVKLLGALSLWLGVFAPWALAGAAAGGLLAQVLGRSTTGRRAFGPFLAAAAWCVGMGMEWGWWRMT